MATPITVAQALAYEQDPSSIPAGAVFDLVDIAANIEALTAPEISALTSIGVHAITSTDNLVTFAPGGAQETALDSSGLHITAEITESTAVQLDIQAAATAAPVLVPENEHVVVLDTAANLEALTPTQLQALKTIVDPSTDTGADSGKSAVHQIAATDTLPVFTADQMTALGNANVAVVSPPGDAAQNDGTVTITGRGMTFVVTFDTSVASAPAAFKTDVEEVFQFYADTYSSPVTLYYHVGFGEVDNQVMSGGDLGESDYTNSVGETYANVLTQLAADATSPAQRAALATLPLTDPTSNKYIGFSGAEAQILGFANAPVSSVTDPDGYVGFSDDTDWDYNADPNQKPGTNEYGLLSTVEHEISEVMGRTSAMGTGTTEQATGDFSLMDLYRYSAPGTRALTPFADPSYFSIDDGTTNLADWNNYTSGDSGDLGDWSGTTVNGAVQHTADAFNDAGTTGFVDPFTATDATLMNVLGDDLAAPPPSPLPLPSSDITLSAGELLEDITLNEINPGSVNPPAGDSYVVIDTAFAIESITAAEFTQALAIGVSEFIVDGAIANLRSDQIAALNGTQFDAVLTLSEAFAAEAALPTVPTGETVIIADSAADIEALTPTQLIDFGAISASHIVVSDLNGVGPLTLEDGYDYSIAGPVSSGETITFAGTGTTLTFTDTADMHGTIDGFDSSEKLRLKDVPFDSNGSVNPLPNNMLEVTENGTSYSLQLNPAQDFSDEIFRLAADPNGGTDITESAAPPVETSHNDGTTIITGRGATFDIVWDSSVASAPAAFKTDVEQVFQFFADTYSSPVALYYHVGYGEYNGNAIGSDFLGRSQYFNFPQESYSSIVSQLEANATSPAQAEAYASLPANDPFADQPGALFVPGAEAQVLGFADAGTSSESNPDGYIGFATDTAQAWNYSADPNQTPVAGEEDFLASVEHELTEILGRGSYLGDTPNPDFSVMDLFRFTSPGTYAVTPNDDPAYFSIDDGTTNLGRWNDFTTGDNGDPGDWWGTTATDHPPNSFNDNSFGGIINPFTANDATLMNVLGYNFTSAPASPIPLPSTDITLSAGQLLEYLTFDTMNPGSMNAPAGDSYVVIDTAFALESITAPEITQALAIGVSEFISDGAIALLQSSDPADDQVDALGTTPFVSVLTVSEALTDAADPPTVPTGEVMSTVIVADTATNIEALTPTQLLDFGAISATHIVVSDLNGVGPLTLEDGYDYSIAGPVSSGETITFAATGTTLTFTDTADMDGTIDGFDSSEKFRLKDVTFDPNGSANLLPDNVLEVSENGTAYSLQLNPLQNFSGEFFHLAADARGGTDIVESTTPCYCRGTRIRTRRGQKRVEKLKIGDKVMTKSGVARPIKWIGRRSFAGRFIMGRKDILPVCIKAGALGGNAPRRDLWLSPLHAMYFERSYFDSACFADGSCMSGTFDGVLIEAKDLINGSSIVQAEHVERVEYFHIELDRHDVIIAEGALSETFIDVDSRGMFHNADEFHALYPQPRPAPAQYCAPRLAEGFEVAAVRRRIAWRAGLTPSADPRRVGSLRGAIDEIGPRRITGWAQNAGAPEVPVCLDIYAGGHLLGRTLANLHREDSARAGLGSCGYAFSFALPEDFALAGVSIEVRRSSDGVSLLDASGRRAAA